MYPLAYPRVGLLSLIIAIVSISVGYAQTDGREKDADQVFPLDIRYITLVPRPRQLENLCATDSGRLQIIQDMDTVSRYDTYYQWVGRREQRDSVPDTFQGYLLEMVNQMCANGQGYTGSPKYKAIFESAPQHNFFYFTSLPTLPNYIYCESANEEGGNEDDCNANFTLAVPKDYQVCKLLYRLRKVRRGELRITPTQFMVGSSQNPPPFRAYTINISGHGDEDNPSSVFLYDVRIFAINAKLGMDERIRCGCDIPSIPPPPVPLPPPSVKTTVGPAKMSFHVLIKRVTTMEVMVKNTGESPGRMAYRVDYLDRDTKEWKLSQESDVILNPKSDWTFGLQHFDATDWRVVYSKTVTYP